MIRKNLIKFQKNSHNSGIKKVFFSQEESVSSLTQFAYGELKQDEIIEAHKHPTMEEYFYFFVGDGLYIIDGKSYLIYPGAYFKIPLDTMHSLKANSDSILKFVYFGISVEL